MQGKKNWSVQAGRQAVEERQRGGEGSSIKPQTTVYTAAAAAAAAAAAVCKHIHRPKAVPFRSVPFRVPLLQQQQQQYDWIGFCFSFYVTATLMIEEERGPFVQPLSIRHFTDDDTTLSLPLSLPMSCCCRRREEWIQCATFRPSSQKMMHRSNMQQLQLKLQLQRL